MKCPTCGNEMESGYIHCREIIWSTDKDPVYVPNYEIGDVKLRETFRGTKIESDICKSCKIILVNYSKLPNTSK